MESNRDEALRCLRLAEKFLQQGDKDKAAKFGLKAKKLFPSGEAEGMKNMSYPKRKNQINKSYKALFK